MNPFAPTRFLPMTLAAVLFVAASVTFTFAQTPATPTPLTFEQARAQLRAEAPALKAAQSRLAGKKDSAAALKGLNYPEVDFDVRYFTYRKTFNEKQFSIDTFNYSGLPLPFPPINADALSHFKYDIEISQNPFQPVLSGHWALYTGGQIKAAQGAAASIAEQAGAQLDTVREALDLELVRAYFGQQLAQRVVALRKDLLAGMRQHLDNALKLEKGGMITKGQRLQAQVAYDAAQRGCDAAEHALENARIGLSALLHTDDALAPTTQLFILKKPVAALATFVVGARERNPQVRAVESLKRAAEHGAKAEKARWSPKVYVFGNYNVYRNGETLTDVDWAAGIGVHWAVFDKIDRRKTYSAAKHAINEASESAEHVRMMADAGARQAYDGLASALKQFELLESNLEAARENLRVQELTFKEGQGISTDVTNARIALTNVLVERAVAAYQFDLELAKLLHASGQMDRFAEHMKDASSVTP